MVKSQPERVFIVTNIISHSGNKKSLPEMLSSEGPPKIPPRMKKKGPALPEKPLHMRANPSTPSQPLRDPLRPRSVPFNSDNRQTEREVLVAASRGGARERPVEKRQREPAKLLMPTSGTGAPMRKELTTLEDRLSYPTKKVDIRPETTILRKSRPPPQPILLIPRGMVPPWGSAPVSYALWMQREAVAPASVKGALSRREPVKSILDVSNKHSSQRSSSVTRSGSLTSQGSSSSDSGNETFPKSVLKKQKRHTPNSNAKGSVNNSNCKKLEHKKNVTFNAFATVQLMEE